MSEILNILGSVGFNWHVALANFINFLIILFLLNKFFFGKLGKTIQTRHEIIERGLSNASDAEKALAEAEEEKRKIVKEAKTEGQEIVNEAHLQATTVAQNIVQEAEAEAAKKGEALAEKEASLARDVEKAFAEKAPALVAELYTKTLQKEVNAQENDALIARIKA